MHNNSKSNLLELNSKITECSECDRLVSFREKIAKNKRKMYQNEIYWGKPIVGFGDENARLLIIGLAPAAHGGNRTGRVFTGDKSSDFLFKCLNEVKISNQDNSNHVNDGLKLFNTYLTLSLKCVPPEDKPTKQELLNCFKYFKSEINYLKNVQIILALGKIAFDSVVQFYNLEYKTKLKNLKFSHGIEFELPDNKVLVGCYHPSPRNVNTGRIDFKKFVALLKSIKKKINNE
jgi:uracil-DNA glycosylase family 4